MVTIDKYYSRVREFNYKEQLTSNTIDLVKLKDFLEFGNLSFEVKIHIAFMLIRRSVGISGGIWMPGDVDWYINNFILEYKVGLKYTSRYVAVRKAIEMIQSHNPFSDGIIGTVYMYTVIEYFAKYKLGLKIYLNSNQEAILN